MSKYDNLILERKEDIINDYVMNHFSIREVCEKYKICSKTVVIKLLGNKLRTHSESNKVAHQKFPDKFKHSEKTKEKMRQKRLSFMKEHPEKTAWRIKNISYPEKCFQKYLQERGYDKKYLIKREYSVFPYFIDFAFIEQKVAVEIDGSQHLEKKRKEIDEAKDKLLIENGWSVIRFTENTVKTDWKNIDNTLKKILFTKPISVTKVGIFKSNAKCYIKKERGEDGLTEGERLRAIKQRKVERPSKEELLQLVYIFSFEEVGRRYGVSGKTISKWCKGYNLPYKRKDINAVFV